MKNTTLLKFAMSVSCMATLCYGQDSPDLVTAGGAVGTWSVQTNTSEWNQALGVTFTRQGCPAASAY